MRERERAARPITSETRTAALDATSDHLGEVLRRADQLLAEWARFGETVRAQVEREAGAIGDAVASAVDGAATRGVAASVDRTLAAQLGPRLAALADEVGRLEGKTRAISRSLADQRTRSLTALWVIVAGVIAANALLVVLVVRGPREVPVIEPAPVMPAVSAPTEPAAAVVPDAPPPAAPPAEVGSGSAGSGSAAVAPEVRPKHAAGKTYGAPVKRP